MMFGKFEIRGLALQEDQVLIKEKDGGFAVILIQSGLSHPMDHRKSFEVAKGFAMYLANSVMLPVYYRNQKLK